MRIFYNLQTLFGVALCPYLLEDNRSDWGMETLSIRNDGAVLKCDINYVNKAQLQNIFINFKII